MNGVARSQTDCIRLADPAFWVRGGALTTPPDPPFARGKSNAWTAFSPPCEGGVRAQAEGRGGQDEPACSCKGSE